MSMTALDLSADALREYHPWAAIRRRATSEKSEVSQRRGRASVTARKAAELLRSEFGAQVVIIFGSLARRGGFTLWSDIDIAATGIPPARFFEAVGVVTGLSAEFKMDLIDLETCPPALHERIVTEGKEL
jgi:predicted nucleotidyltransferase